MATNFEPHECVHYVQSTKIGTHENKAIHTGTVYPCKYFLKYSLNFSFNVNNPNYLKTNRLWHMISVF